MKKINKMMKWLLLWVSFLLVTAVCVPALSENSTTSGSTVLPSAFGTTGENYLQISANDRFGLYLDTTCGEFAVIDTVASKIWYSNPAGREDDSFAKGNAKTNLSSQLIVEFMDAANNNATIANSYTGSIQQGAAKFAKIPNGFASIYTFPEQNVTIPIEVTLKDDYVNVCVKYDNIEENGTNLVTSITLLPYFGAGSTSDNGYLLVPDGCGALINFNNGRQTSGNYKEEIYGIDAAVYHKTMQKITQKATMPVFGIQSSGQGLFAIIDTGAANLTVNGEVSMRRTSYNTVFPSFDVRLPVVSTIGTNQVSDYPDKRIGIGDINIRYYPYAGDGGYSEMAEIYRKYLTHDKGMKKTGSLQDLYIEFIGGYARDTSFWGIPYTKIEELTTFLEAQEILENFIDQGTKDFSVLLTNFNKSTVNGKQTKSGDYLRILGGSRGYTNLKSYLDENDVGCYLMTNLVRYSRSDNPFSVTGNAVRNINNSPSKTFDYSLSTYTADKVKAYYFLHPSKLESSIQKMKARLLQSGDNIGISDMANTVYADSGMAAPASKTQTVSVFENVLSQLSGSGIGVLAVTSNGYAFPYVSHIVAAPAQASLFGIENESIPFYQMVISGWISYSIPALNLSSTTRTMFLKAIETGSALYYVLIANDGKMLDDPYYQRFYSTDPSYWTDIAISQYKEIRDVLSHAGNRVIVSHEKIAEEIFKTTYENGFSVIVNYGDAAYDSGFGSVDPMGYLIAG